MEKFEAYAEAVRSGKVNQVTDSDIDITKSPGPATQSIAVEPIQKDSKKALLVSAAIVALLVAALAWLGWKKEISQKAEVVERNIRAELVAWAKDVGIGLDCKSMTVKNKRQVILHECRFNTAEEREMRQIKKL